MDPILPDVAANLRQIKQQIAELEQKYSRRGEVLLVGVSKTKPVQLIEAALQAGLHDIAENYVQEALEKQPVLAHWPATWHFIGPIQSNKTGKIAQHFSWVHSVDSLRIAERLSRQRPESMADLNVLIQVNISAESSKSGIQPDQLDGLTSAIIALPRLRLRGLMAVPASTSSLEEQRVPFRRLRNLLAQLQRTVPTGSLDQLSMGMSHDLEAAIAEGATMVRIGTALFGSRS
jgi:hypothetical protein